MATNGAQNIVTAATGTILRGAGVGVAPTFSTSTYPATNAINTLLYASSADVMSALATGNDGVLVTSHTGVPSWLANGTAGQVLTANTNLPPTWATPTTGTVTSVSGTTNRITSTGGATPVIDISASYVGQSTITTLGTIATGVWNGTVVGLTYGGTNAALVASNGGIFYSTASAGAILSGTATANKVLMSASSTAPVWSTPTFPNASATSGKFIQSDGTNWIASTPTIPATAGTSGKILISDGTNIISSTPTYPNAASTSLKHIKSDGTNFVTTTVTYPDASVTAGKVIVSDGTNYIASTPTFPNASATAGKFIRSDGTNWAASTPTYPNANAINTLLYASSADVMSALATANSAVLATNSSGVPSITATPTVTSITFGSGTALSTYAEGTFGPTLVGFSTAGTTTYANQQGYYTRVGNIVQISSFTTGSAATGTGFIQLGGLPFTVKNAANSSFFGPVFSASGATWPWPTNCVAPVIQFALNTTTAFFYVSQDASLGVGAYWSMGSGPFNIQASAIYQI